MTPKSVILAVDRLLREEKGIEVSFGGCVLVYAGDFRQFLPVAKGNPTLYEVYRKPFLCLSYADKIKYLKLSENIRIMYSVALEDRERRQAQATALLKLGMGPKLPNGKGFEKMQDLGVVDSQ